MRLDVYLVNKGLCRSRDRAKELIKQGVCSVNGEIVLKVSKQIDEADEVILKKSDYEFVGRGALKLEKALDEFAIVVEGKVILDVGVATGGFTDCLVRRGARMVYALDIGAGQLADELKNDERVFFLNQTDIRTVEPSVFEFDLDLIVVDVSFISLRDILDNLLNVANDKRCDEFIFLVKPQYEMGKKHSGVIKEKKVIERVLRGLRSFFKESGLTICAEIESPIKGKEGNIEFLWHVKTK